MPTHRDQYHIVTILFGLRFQPSNRSALEADMERVSALVAFVANDGRYFGLKPSEWWMLLFGVAVCGFATLFF